MRSFPDLIYVTSRASASGDTATRAVVKNCGGNDHLTRRRTWVVLGFIELVMERSRSRSFVIRDLVVYTEPVVDAIDGVRVICLVRLLVHASIGSFTVVLYLFVLGVGLVKVSRTP